MDMGRCVECGREIPDWCEICPECAVKYLKVEKYDPEKHGKIVIIIR